MTMKTMLEILIRLRQLHECCDRNDRNRQLTDSEKNTVRFFKSLVRGCLPTDVLIRYDRMTLVESELHDSAEVFAMAVLVTTWRELSPARRRKLETHFNTPSRNHQPVLRAARSSAGLRSRSLRGPLTQSRSRSKSLQS